MSYIRKNAQNPLEQTYFPYRKGITSALASISNCPRGTKINGTRSRFLQGGFN